MKRFAVLLLTLALAVCCTLPAFAADTIEVNEDVSVSGDYDWTRFKGQNITLNVYNWGEYISDGSDDSLDTIKAFEQWYYETYGVKVKVNYSTYASNEDMYAKIAMGGSSYDVIIPSDYMIERMAEEGLLHPLNFDNIPNFEENILDEFKNPEYDPENRYSVPYCYGMVGIIYNANVVDEDDPDIGSWKLMFNEDSPYRHDILQFNNSRDAFGTAQYYLGFDVNDENPEKLTMRFDEKVLEVLERTNITTVTLLNRSGAAVMQYNVSDLRAAYDQYGLSDADQLVVGGMDDDVMKIGADGQLVPVE